MDNNLLKSRVKSFIKIIKVNKVQIFFIKILKRVISSETYGWYPEVNNKIREQLMFIILNYTYKKDFPTY